MSNPFIKIQVTMVMKSGKEIRFFADDIKVTWNKETDILTSLNATKTKGWPLYFMFSEVAAIQTRMVPFWATL